MPRFATRVSSSIDPPPDACEGFARPIATVTSYTFNIFLFENFSKESRAASNARPGASKTTAPRFARTCAIKQQAYMAKRRSLILVRRASTDCAKGARLNNCRCSAAGRGRGRAPQSASSKGPRSRLLDDPRCAPDFRSGNENFPMRVVSVTNCTTLHALPSLSPSSRRIDGAAPRASATKDKRR